MFAAPKRNHIKLKFHFGEFFVKRTIFYIATYFVSADKFVLRKENYREPGKKTGGCQRLMPWSLRPKSRFRLSIKL